MSDPTLHHRLPLGAPSTDEWQRHAGFLKRVARGLLADAGLADDALQDAWIHANRRSAAAPARGRSRRRAWLAAVVRNAAAGLTRSEARLHSREQRAARDESLPSAAETAARLEVLHRVVDAVHGLEEPYRTVVLFALLR